MHPLHRLLIAAIALLTTFSATQAATLLNVDFDHNTPESITQSGFQTFRNSLSVNYSAPAEVASGSITVTLAAGSGSRLRTGPLTNSGSFTYADLYRDLYVGFQNVSSPDSSRTVLTLSGLNPNTQYFVKLYSFTYDFDSGALYSWYDTTSGTPALLGTTPANRASSPPTSNDEFAVYNSFTTNASGTATFGFTSLNASGVGVGSGALNGLVLYSVPEPHLTTLAATALGFLFYRRRR
ncbi:hypothetical protein FEM03_18175 [Phragmitibacter flavus]|uniref:PEP-CTERM sorting domain-containing protein n=1 Tax=Phragmitibacter flavus TaxID=2576071 RepID=A0A5R8KAG1_9BACT|nr:hypothetical protein [Phragmitibacter flavus]TLD69300.1 hypothetical protein FEM03_18175 [Phragmitibacter flavus]